MQTRYYISMFIRRLPWFLLVAGAISGIAITVAMTLPPAYVSRVRLIVESSQIPGDLAASTVQVSAQEQLQLFETRLLTRANMLEIARKTEVLPDLRTMSPDAIVDAMRSRTNVSSSAGRNQATLMTMSFQAPSPRKAAAVLNEYLSVILRDDAEFRTTRAGQTQEFFETEVTRLSSELDTQSARILAFKNENADALPESLDYRRGRQLSQQSKLQDMEREIVALNEQRERLKQVFETSGRIDNGGVALTPAQQRRDRLQRDLSEALAIYSETNPKIVALKSRLAQAEAQVADEANAPQVATSSSDEDERLDPARAMFDLQMSEIESRLDFLERQKAEGEALLAELTENIEKTPANAIALDALERDFDNTQSQYNKAVDRLARASTGERIETLSRGQRISVVEQPTVPNAPTKPNRMMIAGGGTAVGVLAGILLVVGLELLNNTVRRPVDLVKSLGITPLATIPYLRTRRQKIRRRVGQIAMILLVAAAVPSIIYAVHTYYLPLDLIADRVMNKIGIRG